MLEEGLVKLGIDSGDKVIPLLAKYIEEIELFNPAYGLVKVKDRRELIVKHILDSLAPLRILQNLMKSPAARIADIGSGAGLPGIPLAICMPGVNFTLVERMGRRAGFLRDVIAVLGLSNVNVEEKDVEELAQKPSATGSFDLIVFRAWKPLDPVLLKGLSKLLASGGILAAYKGRRESIEEEMTQLFKTADKGAGLSSGTRGTVSWEAIPLEVPFLEEERHLLLIRL